MCHSIFMFKFTDERPFPYGVKQNDKMSGKGAVFPSPFGTKPPWRWPPPLTQQIQHGSYGVNIITMKKLMYRMIISPYAPNGVAHCCQNDNTKFERWSFELQLSESRECWRFRQSHLLCVYNAFLAISDIPLFEWPSRKSDKLGSHFVAHFLDCSFQRWLVRQKSQFF